MGCPHGRGIDVLTRRADRSFALLARTSSSRSDYIRQQYDRITAHQLAQSRAQQQINDLLFGTAALETAATGGQQSLAHTNIGGGPGIEANIVDALQKTGLQEFGFVIFKINNGYSEDRWQELKLRWPSLANDGRTSSGDEQSSTDEHGRPWPSWKWVGQHDEDLRSLDVHAISTRFSAMREQIPDGLDLGIALAIDAESLASFNDPPTSEDDTTGLDNTTVPWVYAVHVHHEGNDDEGTRGYFKVSVRSLLPDLWPTLALDIQMPEELEAAVGQDDVWEGVF